MFLFFCIVCMLFFIKGSNLLLSLLLLEILSFVLLYFSVFFVGGLMSFECYSIVLFSVFVMEGVIGLSGLIVLVSYTGSDYISSIGFMKF